MDPLCIVWVTHLCLQAFTRVESINIYHDGQDVSPDRVFDLEAASRAPVSAKEAKLLSKLRERLEKETQEVRKPASAAKGCIERASQASALFAASGPQCLVHRHLYFKRESNGFLCMALPACVIDWPCEEDVPVHVYTNTRGCPTLLWGAATGGVMIP